MNPSKSPWAVIISDVHYSLGTLELANAAMRQAINKAEELRVPLVVAGDLHDTKGILRAECMNAMIETFRSMRSNAIVLVGNHDRINEKGKEHALEFLAPHCILVDTVPVSYHGLHFIPYESDPNTLLKHLRNMTPGATIVAHTGVQTAYMGHYTQDKSSLPPMEFADFRVISGHYHKRQDVKCGKNTFSYVGNPYTLNFGEAQDGPKGFVVLYQDGSVEQIPTNLRKHIVLDRCIDNVLTPVPEYRPGDLVKLRVSGPRSELLKLDRTEIGKTLFGTVDYKLDLNPDKERKEATKAKDNTQDVAELFDSLIDALSETKDQKNNLKSLWRTLLAD